MDVIRVGDINSDSFEQLPNKIRYAYTLEKNDVKLKVVVDEYNDGKKIFDYYSDRNFIDYNNKTRVDTDMAAISKNNQKVSVKNNYLQGFLYISLYIFICFKIYIKSLFVGSFIYFCMSLDFLRYCIMVPEVGLEPTQGCPYQILSLTRLPVSPLGLS